MSELLDVALRMIANAGGGRDQMGESLSGGLPATVPYADYVRRFEPATTPAAVVTRASAVAHVLRVSRALETLSGLALAHAARTGPHDSDHLYRAHGDPRD